MNQSLSDPAAPDAKRPLPWGVVGTIVWGAAGVCAWFLTQFAAVIIYIAMQSSSGDLDPRSFGSDGFLLALVTIVAGPVWIAVSWLAARWRGWNPRDYLALVWPKRSEFIFGVACLAALLVAFDLLTLAFGRDVVPRFMVESYTTARDANALVLFFIAVAIVAPITEEIAFRGFIFRGLSESWLGLSGTLIATSAAWALMHVQYDWVILGQILLIGLLLGWLRWASGSTVLTIVLHMLANFVATIQAAIKVEWIS